jgi:uroporphyrin-III C-methyltransferase
MTCHPTSGQVYLVGAGPGDPDLLTLRAVRALNEADVVLYDRLVSTETLKLARPGAALIYVGKEEGEQDDVQRQIMDLLVHHARQGKTVVRLKGGDPLVFGRGGEEWQVLQRHGIAVTLVPGISSATAVPGLAAIPLTFRGVSSGFAVVTGQSQDGQMPDWSRYARVETLIILMGVRQRSAIARALIACGRDAEDAVAFVERGSLPSQRVTVTSLAEVAAGGPVVQSPAVMVVGPVVHLRAQLLATINALASAGSANSAG